MDKDLEKLYKYISKLNFISFMGVAKILTVPIKTENDEFRDAKEILEEMGRNFLKASPKFKKDFLKILNENEKERKILEKSKKNPPTKNLKRGENKCAQTSN